VRITSDLIARTALRLLNDVGLDGLTMRLLAKELGVQAPTLYWHVKNKQELLDLMADLMSAEVGDGLEAPGRGTSWQDWAAELTRRMRRTMLRYRDGARVTAGAYSRSPAVPRTIELTLRTFQDAGFPVAAAARAFPVLLHYTVGFTIEEQARTGAAYAGDDNPYTAGMRVDPGRHPLTAAVADELYAVDSEANFEYGLRIILTGMRVEVLGP
jgi:TetR/AcrR family transcriptional regulator, tetracycline repressor protein